ncbi:MAG: hypothetical protein HBSAPP02_19770 [Phycisphaerae bacterium]|nr:MAG: hypothetical protein HRU71_15175 [Planctomycetia bacterium]RIK70363.1 MAG: hypothetical protein DCC66_05485 [Planctomycetota bacterium]GJQ26945.1 MAG: hypothetical protein HBSAPP02_19770 [Phycisphaerae bacterium]
MPDRLRHGQAGRDRVDCGLAPSGRLVRALALCLGLYGCSTTPTRIEILSFKRVEEPVRYAETFDRSHYCRDAHGNWLIVMEMPPVWVEGRQAETDARPGSSHASGWTSQLVHVEVFWVPYPGRTHAESTQTNAAITYHLVTPSGVLTYEGAGFVYFQPPRPGKPLVGRIESGSLLRAKDVTDANDLFGPCRLRGSFTAQEDRRAVFRALNEMKRTRARTLALEPATAADPASANASN